MNHLRVWARALRPEASAAFCNIRRIFLRMCLSSVAAVGGLLLLSLLPGSAAEPSDRVVVMVSVDGMAGYYLDDPKAEMPTIRALAAAGARASAMMVATPTVTWPCHTTLITGANPARHGVVGNNYLDRTTGKRVRLISDPVYDKDEIVKVPTLYDLAKSHGFSTAAIRWPASRNAKTLDWTIPDMASGKPMLKYSTPALLEACQRAGISIGTPRKGKDVIEPSDATCTRIFNMVMRDHHPNLALLHLFEADHTQHLHGPRSPEAYAAVKAADNRVRDVWNELKHDFPDRATLFVVSDHGFAPVERMLLPNVLLRKAGLVASATNGSVQVVVQSGAAMVYVLDSANRAKLIAQIRKALSGLKGLSKIITADEFKDYGVANPKDDPHAPDLILFAEEGCTFGDTADGDLPFAEKPERKGTHGHDPNLPDLQATFVAWGVGIKPGVNLGKISSLSVAPTMARLLGFSIPDAEGAPLTNALAGDRN
jgi:predicted AlkP superfamily pyrophosphatase or phosphodiesterase